MKKVLVNYADEVFESVRKVNTWTGRHIARFNDVIECSPNEIDDDFRRRNQRIFEYKRGNGLWLWKPYFINKILRNLDDGDILFYLDAGAFFVRKIDPLIEAMTDDVFVTDLPFIEEQWTKPRVFTELCQKGDVDRQSNQIQASFIMLRKSRESEDFVRNWLGLCCRIELISPEEGDGIDGALLAHREDQSLLSILCKKKGIQPHKDPSLFGRFPERYRLSQKFVFRIPNHPTDSYHPVIVLHRMHDVRIKTFSKLVLLAILPYGVAKKMNCWGKRGTNSREAEKR